MLASIWIGCALLFVTTFIHASAMGLCLSTASERRMKRYRGARWHRMVLVAGLVIVMFVATVIEALTWAGVYIVVGAMDALEPALYFSMVTYTTLGYGELVLGPEWRLLASFQAANGIIMFGWTTALIVSAIHYLYLSQDASQVVSPPASPDPPAT